MATRVQSPYLNAERVQRDLVYEDGDLKMDDTQMSDIAVMLGTEYGSAVADPTFGCKVWTITKLHGVVPERARQYVREALQARIDSGRISNVEVDAEIMARGYLAWEVGIEFGPDESIVMALTAEDAIP